MQRIHQTLIEGWMGGGLGSEIQVRAQEMVFASQRVDEFRERKLEDKNKLLNHLKVYPGRFYPFLCFHGCVL